jgi:uncharacterized protein (DUF362 family)
MYSKKIMKIVFTLTALSLWFIWDFSQADQDLNSFFKSYRMASEFDAVSSATTKVSIVRSNYKYLEDPVPVDDAGIEYKTIEEMVRKAIDLVGGTGAKSGDMVLLKPNIVDADPSGNGEVTDIRVVKALVKIIDEIDHGKMKIVIGEGSPVPINYELEYDDYYGYAKWGKLWDVTGYQDLLNDPYLDGIDLRLSNLNCHMPGPDWKEGDGWPPDSAWKDLVLVDVPGGGLALPQKGKYWVHKDVLNADIFITVPVMKIHTTVLTAAIKNQIGIAPSTIYGFWKQFGVPQNNKKYKLIHEYQAPKWWTHKEVVDLANIAGVDFAVVDAIGCLEREKDAGYSDNFVRMNTIIAGKDIVAVDNVCARIMELNPDDVEHITLAEKIGLGTNDPNKIIVEGNSIEETKRRFVKSYFGGGQFGQGNRDWIVSQTFSISGISDAIDHEFISNEAVLTPKPGEAGWSKSIYFTDNRIDLKDYYQLGSEQVVSYAFCYFKAPKNQEAELWIGSDEALKIYINGKVAYRYDGTRTFPDDEFTSEKVKIKIKSGENTLLVKSLQKYGRYDFCLNICEPEEDEDYDGNRVYGLKFKTTSDATAIERKNEPIAPKEFKLLSAYPNPFNSMVKFEFILPHSGKVDLNIVDITGRHVRTLYSGFMESGRAEVRWNGKNDAGQVVSSGMYVSVFAFDGQTLTQRVVLTK